MKSVELFAGAGGLALAVSEAGFEHVAILERDRYACQTIRENRALGTRLVIDWPSVEPTDVRKFDYSLIGETIDLVAGGPPCQPFSLGGKHRAFRDSRDMFPEAVRAIRELRPRAFIFENVRGLLRSSFMTYFDYILLQLQHPEVVRIAEEEWPDHLARLERIHTSGADAGLKYNVVPQLLNAADYGVPQRRERVFIVGFRSDLEFDGFSFPQATHSQEALLWDQYVTGEYWQRHGLPKPDVPSRFKRRVEKLAGSFIPPSERPWRTVRDAIGSLPNPCSKAAKSVLNHRFNPGARAYHGHTGSPLDEPAKTLKAGDHGVPGGENMLALPDGTVRYFTVRESAKLQTFPDDYYFPGSWTETMRQLGNAVPTDLGKIVAAKVFRLLSPKHVDIGA